MPASRPQPARRQHAALLVEYDGTPFHGWTRQPGGRLTIEAALREAFSAVHCHDVDLRCAGRTDAGVHASHQVVDAWYVGSIAPERLALALSTNLPRELAVVRSEPAVEGFDARLDATSRAYEYRLLPRKVSSPLRERFLLHHPRRLDREVLDACAAAAIGTHRFTAFTPSRTAHVYFDRTLATSRWVDRDDELVYEVRGNAFLRHMVRVLVGTMLAVGRGEGTHEAFCQLLDGAPRSEAFQTAPPQGLCLVDVTWEPVVGLPLPPDWRAGHAPEHRDPSAPPPFAVPFSSAG